MINIKDDACVGMSVRPEAAVKLSESGKTALFLVGCVSSR